MPKATNTELAIVNPASSGDVALQHDLMVITKEKTAELAMHLLPGEEYDSVIIISKLLQVAGDMAQRMYEVGRLLTLIRVNEEKHVYQNLRLQLGVSDRFIGRCLTLYAKYGNGKRAELVSQLTTGKLLELAGESDEDLDQLAMGGEISGIPRDQIDLMTVRDVKDGLRKAKADLDKQRETTDKLIKKRDERIAKLEEQLELGDQFPAAERAQDVLSDIAKASAQLITSGKMLLARAYTLIELETDGVPPEFMENMRQQIELVWTILQPISNLVVPGDDLVAAQ